jgi:predicted permease
MLLRRSIFDAFLRELRFAVRRLRQTPGFTLTAVLTVAICLGANLAIFAALNSIVLRPLPFPSADRLVSIFNTYPKAGVDRDGSSITNYYERRGRIPALCSISLYAFGTAIVGESGSAERESITRISPEFFTTLGRGPAMGRSFTDSEMTFQTDNVAILSYEFWRAYFHADPKILGRQIRVDGSSKTIVGVLPSGFHFLSSKSGIYLPLSSRLEDRAPSERHSGGNVKQMIARLSDGATIAQAQSQIDAQNTSLEASDPKAKMMADAGFRSLVRSLHGDHIASVRPLLLLLQAGVFLLLLIGGANLVNLLLVRAGARMKEMAVRQALGASRGYIVGEVLLETTLLTLAGGFLGMVFGAGGTRLLDILGAERLPLGSRIAFDSQVALVALAAALVLGIVLATPIAWFQLRRHLHEALKSETRSGTATHAAQTLRHSFVVAQIAVAFILLAGAGLLGLSLERAMEVSPGFRPDHVLSAQVSLVGNKYPSAMAGLVFSERFTGALESQPGIIAAGAINNIPFSGYSGKSAATVEGHVIKPGEAPRGHYSYGVAGDYFQTMGFTLRAGRFLNATDSRSKERVCVVDEDFARYYWPNTSPIGHRLWMGSQAGSKAEAFTVIGVVGGVKQAGLTDVSAQGAVYYPYIYRPDSHLFLVARSRQAPESIAQTMRRAVGQIDPELALADVQPMKTRIADSLTTRRSPALLAGLFSAIALLLTALGTYGVLSYAVSQRRREIGVRMALGAMPRHIRSQFVFLAARMFAAGTAFGMVGAWLVGKAMQSVLFEVRAFDVPLLLAGALLVAVVSLGACLLPAGRAARISPMEVLNSD